MLGFITKPASFHSRDILDSAPRDGLPKVHLSEARLHPPPRAGADQHHAPALVAALHPQQRDRGARPRQGTVGSGQHPHRGGRDQPQPAGGHL